jgi:hypothetical protein
MLRVIAIIAACCSLFFAFYTIRLLAVTAVLTRTRPGGGGAYIGAAVFPILALLFAWAAWRAWRAAAGISNRSL